MGSTTCCDSEKFYTQNVVNQKDLIEVFKSEQQELHRRIEIVNLKKKQYLNERTNLKFNSLNSEKIKLYMNKIEENFYLVSLYSCLKWLEERFSNEKYKAFQLLKNEFFLFYKRVKEAYDYNLLMNENEMFNKMLDENLLTPKHMPFEESERFK